MGRRQRRRGRETGASAAERPEAPTSDYTDPEGSVLTLRGALSPASRRRYAETLAGGLDREDAWQRAGELLFEQLAVSWTIAGIETRAQKELLLRYRAADQAERRFVRESLRAHLAEHFPELPVP
jgi:hypothetical protein